MKKTLTTLSMAAIAALSATAAQSNDSLNNNYYQLFTPVTFYHNVANNQLALNTDSQTEEQQAVDRALMAVYMNRPDLVEATESDLEEAGVLRDDIEQPIQQQVDMVEVQQSSFNIQRSLYNVQVDTPQVMITKPKFWTTKGDGFLQFMQNYVSGNWYKGGESTYSLLGSLTLEANYDNKAKWKWDNKLEAKLGFLTARSDSLHKWKSNEDLIRLTSKIGLQATKRWYYTLQIMAYTQFTQGLKSNDHHTYSDFFSPFNLNVALGMDYKVEAFNKKLTGTVNLSPIAMNYRYVDRNWFDEKSWFPSRYGVDAEKHHLLDFGPNITADLQWKLSENVLWKSRFYAFSSFHRAQVEWENTFQLKVSKYITANIFLYPRFDDANTYDDDLGYWQFKEYTSLGFSYNF